MAGEGGDPACWLDRVCPTCGALIEDDEHVHREPADEPDEPASAHPDIGDPPPGT